MRRAHLILGFACLANVSCRSMLGLDGVSYDRVELPQGTTDAGPDAGADAGPPLATPYPLVWKKSQFLALPAQPQSGQFRVYDRESGALQTFRASAQGVELASSFAWSMGYSSVLEIASSASASTLIGYDSASGFVEYAALSAASGLSSEKREAGTAGWSEVLSVNVSGAWRLFAYDTATGQYRLAPAEPGEDSAVQLGSSEPGWTRIVAHPLGILKYRADTGAAELDSLTADGLVLVSRGNIGQDWTSVVVLGRQSPELLLYNSASGRVSKGILAQTPLSFTASENAVWRGGISTILPLDVENQPCALTHSAETGVADLVTLEPLKSADTLK